jgi:catechol 2,3-dioxygenase-like lactoylglutathione lyase family enzyme
MALARFKDLCIDISDARASGEYWSTMLGWSLELHDDGDAHLRDDAGRIQLRLNVVPEPKSVKNRVHLDVNAESVQRAVDAGARVDRELPRWTVLLDPDGQEHCVFARAQPFDKRAYELVWDCPEGAQASRDIATWWCAVIGGAVVDDERGFSWVQDIPECPWDSFDFTGVPEPKTTKNRVHVDVATDDLEALVAHGARVLRGNGDDGIAWTVLADPGDNASVVPAGAGAVGHYVMADPDGNEFCAWVEA